MKPKKLKSLQVANPRTLKNHTTLRVKKKIVKMGRNLILRLKINLKMNLNLRLKLKSVKKTTLSKSQKFIRCRSLCQLNKLKSN